MANLNTERAILSAFLFSAYQDDMTKDAFNLNLNVFSTPFNKRVAVKLNEETKGDKAYDFLLVSIEDDIMGTTYESEWIEILAQTPMALSVAKRLHSKLEDQEKERVARMYV